MIEILKAPLLFSKLLVTTLNNYQTTAEMVLRFKYN